jgi:hypothetical protein
MEQTMQTPSPTPPLPPPPPADRFEHVGPAGALLTAAKVAWISLAVVASIATGYVMLRLAGLLS